MSERTLILVKPDGVERGLIGQILSRFESKGYTIEKLKMLQPTKELLAQHYAEHEGKPFYQPLVDFMVSGPVVAAVLSGERVIEGVRSMLGTSDPTLAAPGTIRGDLGDSVQKNLVHASDSPASAEREIALWLT